MKTYYCDTCGNELVIFGFITSFYTETVLQGRCHRKFYNNLDHKEWTTIENDTELETWVALNGDGRLNNLTFAEGITSDIDFDSELELSDYDQ